MNNAIVVKTEIDGKGFEQGLSKMAAGAQGFASRVSGINIKGWIAGLVGASTISAAVQNMVNFSTQVINTSDRLNIATDSLQQFMAIARHAGKDIGFFEGVLRNLEKSAVSALGGNAKKAGLFAALGISNDDLQHLNKVDLLRQTLKGTKGMDRQYAEDVLNGVTGSKSGGVLMSQRNDIINPDKLGSEIVSTEDLQALHLAKLQWEDMAAVLNAKLIPAFVEAAKIIVDLGEKVSRVFQGFFVAVNSFMGGAGGKKMTDTGSPEINMLQGGWNMLKRMFHGDNPIKMFKEGLKAADDDLVKYFVAVDDKEDEEMRRRIARRHALEDAEAAKKGKVNRYAKPEKPMSLENNVYGHGDSGMLKIGGLLGINTNYRLDRLILIQKEQVAYLKEIAKNTAPDANEAAAEAAVEAYTD